MEVEPETRWVYSNPGFAALGQIAEDVSGQPLDQRCLPRAEIGPATLSSAVPVLFVQGGSDPQDPPGNVADAGRHFPNSTTVTVPWAGHGWVWDACLVDLGNDTIVRAAVDSNRTGCVARATPPAFDLSG